MKILQKFQCFVCFLTIMGWADQTADQYEGFCACINPWLGQTFQEHQGDPANTCPTFCYADCLGDCWDIQPAQGDGRCWSEVACSQGQCFVDRLFGRLLDHIIELSGRNTPQLCVEVCYAKGFLFAGVQYSSQCFCGDTAPPESAYAPAGECSSPCPGDANQFCGASWRMNVYSTGLHHKPPTQLSQPNSTSLSDAAIGV